jgi:hypothetical protein
VSISEALPIESSGVGDADALPAKRSAAITRATLRAPRIPASAARTEAEIRLGSLLPRP